RRAPTPPQPLAAAYAPAHNIPALGHTALGLALQHAATDAFLRGLTIGALVAGGVAAAGALLPALFLPAQPAQAPPASQASVAAEGGPATQTQAHPPPAARSPRGSSRASVRGQMIFLRFRPLTWCEEFQWRTQCQ